MIEPPTQIQTSGHSEKTSQARMTEKGSLANSSGCRLVTSTIPRARVNSTCPSVPHSAMAQR